MRRIVCDTGPLIHLFEANLLAILEAAGRVLVPPAVAGELEGVASGPKLRDLPWVETRPLREPHIAAARDWNRAGMLHLGEAEALAATGLLGLPAAEAALDRLRRSSLWVSPRVVDEARRALLYLSS